MRKQNRRKLWIFFCVLLYLTVLPLQAETQIPVDVDAAGSIKIQYQLPDIEVSLYKVADVTDRYEFVVTEEFKKYPIDFGLLKEEESNYIGETLAGYAKKDKLDPMVSGKTDEAGVLLFENLKAGIFLIITENKTIEDRVYRTSPFLVFLPQQTEEGWNYHLEYNPKTGDETAELSDYTVVKLWEDKGREKDRPAEITVQLIKDGEVYDQVVLNQENNWKYTWEGLSSQSVWQAVEQDVPQGYTVTTVQNGTVFEIVNSTEEASMDLPEKLPQTGQIWWPVPVFIIAGLLLILIGLTQRKDSIS